MEGQGSVFGFTLKFDRDRQVATAPPVANNFSSLLSQLGPVKLPLVDDDAMNIFIALKYLEICDNICVTTADNGENALHEFTRTDYDIILTDANMPIMNGYTFAGKVRKDFNEPKSGVPIILLTAELAPPEHLARAGIGVCLLKAFTRDDLYRAVYEAMLKRQTVQVH